MSVKQSLGLVKRVAQGIERLVTGNVVDLDFDDRELFYRMVEVASEKPGCDDRPGLQKERMYELEREMFSEGRNPDVCTLIRAGFTETRQEYAEDDTVLITETGMEFYEENRDEFRIIRD
ncbi:hypothetical protein [Salinibaculum rarum]|uniref:hypothetical protein n=1 Tax=Salinibaculum rarum TaxID=3058903 RepID=UPI00265E985F|nr:hypothetical protein [Salinibaculum sp. KK48]